MGSSPLVWRKKRVAVTLFRYIDSLVLIALQFLWFFVREKLFFEGRPHHQSYRFSPLSTFFIPDTYSPHLPLSSGAKEEVGTNSLRLFLCTLAKVRVECNWLISTVPILSSLSEFTSNPMSAPNGSFNSNFRGFYFVAVAQEGDGGTY